MGRDKREYPRTHEVVPATLYFVSPQCYYTRQEVQGYIVNVSENGVCLEVRDKEAILALRYSLDLGSEIKFQAIDKFNLFENEEHYLLDNDCILRWYSEKNGILRMGCQIARYKTDWIKYVRTVLAKNYVNNQYVAI